MGTKDREYYRNEGKEFEKNNRCLGHFDHCLFGDPVLHSLKLLLLSLLYWQQ